MSIIREIKDEIAAAQREPTSRDLTVLAFLFLFIFTVIGCYSMFWKGNESGYIWVCVGLVLLAARLIPPLFRQIYKYWINFSVVLGYFVSRTILTIVFFIIVTPTGLIMKMLCKDPMERKIDSDKDSYWIPKEQEPDQSVERYQKQF